MIEDYKLSVRADIKDIILRSELDLLRLARRTIIQSRVCTKRKHQAAKLETACSAFGAITAVTLLSKAGADASVGDSNATRRPDIIITDFAAQDDACEAPPPEVSVPPSPPGPGTLSHITSLQDSANGGISGVGVG